MSDRYYHVYVGVMCDKCGNTLAGQGLDGFDGRDQYDRLAVAAGWKIFVGRSRRHYCPDCNPKPGHKMREITERYRRPAVAGGAS